MINQAYSQTKYLFPPFYLKVEELSSLESFAEENGIRNVKNKPKTKRVRIVSYHKHFIR